MLNLAVPSVVRSSFDGLRNDARAFATSRSTVAICCEGANHSVYVDRASRRTATVPRHTEVNDDLAKKICKDLDVPRP
jgi:hypothetical protein